MSGPLPYEVETSPATVVVVTAGDGQKYDVKLAFLVVGVVDTGMKNPLDQMPIFNIATQAITQVTRRTDG